MLLTCQVTWKVLQGDDVLNCLPSGANQPLVKMLDLPPHPGGQLPRPKPLFAMITSLVGGRSNENMLVLSAPCFQAEV